MRYSWPVIVITEDNTVVGVKFIESINITRDEMESTLDVLTDDCIISITTVSGRCYGISAKKQIDIFREKFDIPSDPRQVRDAIFEKWIELLK